MWLDGRIAGREFLIITKKRLSGSRKRTSPLSRLAYSCFFAIRIVCFYFQTFAFEIESVLRFTAQVYGQGLRADIALRNAYALFTGKNDLEMSVFCP